MNLSFYLNLRKVFMYNEGSKNYAAEANIEPVTCRMKTHGFPNQKSYLLDLMEKFPNFFYDFRCQYSFCKNTLLQISLMSIKSSISKQKKPFT